MRPSADRLLRLYPRAWRERYGDEFLATAGRAPLNLQQVIDIVSGAIDAWLSADVRNATRPFHAMSSGGRSMTLSSLIACELRSNRYTKRDSLIGAGVMIGASAALFDGRNRREARGLADNSGHPARDGFSGVVDALDAVLATEGAAVEGADGDCGSDPHPARLPPATSPSSLVRQNATVDAEKPAGAQRKPLRACSLRSS